MDGQREGQFSTQMAHIRKTLARSRKLTNISQASCGAVSYHAPSQEPIILANGSLVGLTLLSNP